MEILSDRIGCILKYGKIMKNLTRRYFYINNKGILFYYDKESIFNEIIKFTTESFNDEKIVSYIRNISKTINLVDCTLSGVKIFLEDKYDLKDRSYFEVFFKERDYRSIHLFAMKEEYTKLVHSFIFSFQENINNKDEQEIANFENQNLMLTEFCNKPTFDVISTHEKNSDIIFSNSKKETYMEGILNKLGGKFKNQINWERNCIKILNPSSTTEVYDETWAELENGSNYSGAVKNGMPHGFGKEYRQDGCLYTGYFFNGKWHGSGTLTNETLDSFQGEFIDGCICGI
jgi:hypothetical protein